MKKLILSLFCLVMTGTQLSYAKDYQVLSYKEGQKQPAASLKGVEWLQGIWHLARGCTRT